MIYQPILNCATLTDGGVRYRLRYSNEFAEPGDPKHDESHIHDYYELYFNLQGDVSFWVNNRLYRIKSGDMIVTKPGDVHLCIYHSPAVHEHCCLWIDFGAGSRIFDYLRGFFDTDYYSFGEEKTRPAELLARLKEQIDEDKKFLQTATIFELFSYLGEKGGAHSAPTQEVMPAPLQEILDDLNANFTDIRTIGDLLSRHYISSATLNRWFRKYLRISPHEFLEAKKLSFAKSKLEEGRTVTEACMLSGFSDCSHFIAVFKKKFGETPFKYKSGIL